MIKILLVEDDEACAYALQGGLELLDSYEVAVAHNGMEGLELFDSFVPDVVVTDIEMPVMDGFELAQQLRIKNKSVIIIMESCRTKPKDVLKGFELGVDDYIKKPFIAEELHAHIRAILKRMNGRPQPEPAHAAGNIYIGNFKFNTGDKTLEFCMQKRKLTERESTILKLLYENKNTVYPREKLLSNLWGGDDFFASRSLDVFVSKLRKYLEQDPSIGIVTVKGKGIMLKIQP